MVCTPPTLRDTAGQCVGGTHPTGMHSCSNYFPNFQDFSRCHNQSMCACSADDFETFYCCTAPPPFDGCINLASPTPLGEGFCENFNNIKCDARCPLDFGSYTMSYGCCRCDENNSTLPTLPPTTTTTTPATTTMATEPTTSSIDHVSDKNNFRGFQKYELL